MSTFSAGPTGQAGPERSGAEFGAGLKDKLQDPGKWRMYLIGFGEMLPDENSYVKLDEEATDEWGISQLRMNVSRCENAEAMRADLKAQAAGMPGGAVPPRSTLPSSATGQERTFTRWGGGT